MKNAIIPSLLLVFVLSACQKELTDTTLTPGNPPISGNQPALKADKVSIVFADTAPASDSFSIQSNIAWTISISPASVNWLQVAKSSGSGNDKIIVTAIKSNLSDTVQKATITIKPGGNTSLSPVTISISQNPAVKDTTRNAFGGTGLDDFLSEVATSDGGIIAIGTTASHDGDVTGGRGQEDIWLVRTDAKGKLVWQKTFGSSDRDFGSAIVAASDGGYVITGIVGAGDGDVTGYHGDADAWVTKLDENGNIVWKKTFGGSGEDELTSIAGTPDGGYLLVGQTNGNDGDVTGNHGGDDGWVLKIDAGGNALWHKTLGGSGYDLLFTGIATADGGYIVGGLTQSNDGNVSGNHGYDDAWVVKLDATGSNIVWQKCFGGTGGENAQSIIAANDGGYVFAGYTSSYGGDVTGFHGLVDAWIVKIDVNGQKVWQKTFGGTGYDAAYNITKTTDNGYIFTGVMRSPEIDPANFKGGLGDAWAVKTDINGNLVQQKFLGGTGNDMGFSVVETSSGNYALAGQTDSKDLDVIGLHGNNDAWLIRFKF